MVSYNKLWKLLIDKRMKKKDLAEAAGISANTIAKMGRDDLVSLEVLVRICRALKCDIGDVIEVIPLPDTDRESTEHENVYGRVMR